MRLTFSILVAGLCHGVLFGVGAVVLSRAPRTQVVPHPVEVEIVAAKPDPIADAAPTAASTGDLAPVLRKPRMVRRPTQVAALGAPPAVIAPGLADGSTQIAPGNDPANTAVAQRPSGTPGSPRPIGSTGAVSTARPRYRTNPTPDYPIASRRRREEGIVLLNVTVDAGGAPAAISLNHSSGYPLLDRAALEAVHRWTFEPARSDGVPMLSRAVVPVRFSLSDRP